MLIKAAGTGEGSRGEDRRGEERRGEEGRGGEDSRVYSHSKGTTS
jgi:hypothetical protein